MRELVDKAVELLQNDSLQRFLEILFSGAGVALLIHAFTISEKRKDNKPIINSIELETGTTDIERLRDNINSCKKLLEKPEMNSYYCKFNLRRIIGNSLLIICIQNTVGAEEKDKKLLEAHQNFSDCIKIARKGFLPNLFKLGKEYRYLLAQVNQNLGRVCLNMIIRNSNSVDSDKMLGYFKNALTLYGRKKSKYEFFRTQLNMATAYRRIADYQYKGNSEKRKEALNKAIMIYSEVETHVAEIKEHEYYDYLVSTGQNDMGVAYFSLGDIENYIANFRKALEKYLDSIEHGRDLYVKKPPDTESSVEYGRTKNNIGLCYFNLSKYEERKINLEKAIKAFDESMMFRKEKKNSEGYQKTQYNHAKARLELFMVNFNKNELDDAMANMLKARTYWDDSGALNEISATTRLIARICLFYLYLDSSNKADYIMETRDRIGYILNNFKSKKGDCADANNILGILHVFLSETENKEENIKTARMLFEEAMTINKENPKYRAYNTINVINTYLNQINDFEKYHESYKTILDEIKSIIEPNESIHSRTALKNCYGIYYNYLARITADDTGKKNYLKKSMEFFDEALNIISSDKNGWPQNCSWIQNNYGITCTDMGSITGQLEDYERSCFMFENAMETINKDNFPLINAFIKCNVLLTNESYPEGYGKININEEDVMDILNRYPQCDNQLKQKNPFFLFIYILD